MYVEKISVMCAYENETIYIKLDLFNVVMHNLFTSQFIYSIIFVSNYLAIKQIKYAPQAKYFSNLFKYV